MRRWLVGFGLVLGLSIDGWGCAGYASSCWYERGWYCCDSTCTCDGVAVLVRPGVYECVEDAAP